MQIYEMNIIIDELENLVIDESLKITTGKVEVIFIKPTVTTTETLEQSEMQSPSTKRLARKCSFFTTRL